jgi:hypothetical protein
MVEDQGRAELADGRGAVSLLARHLKDGFFVQIVAAEMLIDIEDDRIDLEKRRDGIVGVGNRIAGVDRVAEVAGVAEIMAGSHR